MNPIDVRDRDRAVPARALRAALRGRQGGRRRGARTARSSTSITPRAVRRVRRADADRRPAAAIRCPTASTRARRLPRRLRARRLARAGVARAARAGETVLILGASGVVGQIAVQAAKLLGAGRVVAAARDAAALERARDARRRRARVAAGDPTTSPARCARRPAATATTSCSTRCGASRRWPRSRAVKPFGRVVQPGPVGRRRGDADLGGDPLDRRSTCSATRTTRPARSARRRRTRELAGHAAAGEIRVEIERLGLDDVPDAWRRQASSPHAKLVDRAVATTSTAASRGARAAGVCRLACARVRSPTRWRGRARSQAPRPDGRLLSAPSELARRRSAKRGCACSRYHANARRHGRSRPATASSAVSTRGGSAGISRCSRSASANARRVAGRERAVGGERLRRASRRRRAPRRSSRPQAMPK